MTVPKESNGENGRGSDSLPRVLVVDDDPGIVALLTAALTGDQFTVRSAMDGGEALDEFLRDPVDVVVTDLSMPVMGGLGLLRELKRRDPLVEVVVLTAHASIDAAIEAMRVDGAFDFLLKPLDSIDQLITVVGLAASRRMDAMQAARDRDRAEQVRQIALALTGAGSVEQRLASALEQSCRLLVMESSTIYALNHEGIWDNAFSTVGNAPHWLHDPQPPPSDVTESVLADDRAIFVAGTDPVSLSSRPSDSRLPTAFAALPLRVATRPVGVWYLFASGPRQFTPYDQQWMERLADHLALAVEGLQEWRHQQRQAAEARELAATDPLTGLANRRAFREALAHELDRAGHTGTEVALLLADLDDLKTINDVHGHAAGDRAIISVGTALRATLRVGDLAARFGGDEFAAVLPRANQVGARHFAARLRGQLLRQGQIAADTNAAVSLGYAVFPAEGTTAEELLARADERLYADKAHRRTGRSR